MEAPEHLWLCITCPLCGNPVTVVNKGEPVENGRLLNAVVRCTRYPGCGRETHVQIRLMDLGVFDDDGFDHGTPKGFKRHIRLGEPVCDECNGYKHRDYEDRQIRRRAAASTTPS